LFWHQHCCINVAFHKCYRLHVRCKSLHIWQILNTKPPYEMFHLKKLDSFPITINYPNPPINQIIPTKLKSTIYLWLETCKIMY
jgi:hypothetical protein